jgi:iron complex outermembrane receptor protein
VVKPGSADSNEASAESNDPTHQALVQSSMTIPGGFELGAVLRYIGALPDPDVDEYVGLDLRMAWNVFKPLELSVVGQNLLQKGRVEFIPESPAPKDIRRSVYIKLACRL